jgi:hypothetical protein
MPSAARPLDRGNDYNTIAAGQSDQTMSLIQGASTGAKGDVLTLLICVVSTAATAAVSIKDGSGSAIAVLPNSPGAGVGTYVIPLNLISKVGAWKITTGAGVAVVATGEFS